MSDLDYLDVRTPRDGHGMVFADWPEADGTHTTVTAEVMDDGRVLLSTFVGTVGDGDPDAAITVEVPAEAWAALIAVRS